MGRSGRPLRKQLQMEKAWHKADVTAPPQRTRAQEDAGPRGGDDEANGEKSKPEERSASTKGRVRRGDTDATKARSSVDALFTGSCISDREGATASRRPSNVCSNFPFLPANSLLCCPDG